METMQKPWRNAEIGHIVSSLYEIQINHRNQDKKSKKTFKMLI